MLVVIKKRIGEFREQTTGKVIIGTNYFQTFCSKNLKNKNSLKNINLNELMS